MYAKMTYAMRNARWERYGEIGNTRQSSPVQTVVSGKERARDSVRQSNLSNRFLPHSSHSLSTY